MKIFIFLLVLCSVPLDGQDVSFTPRMEFVEETSLDTLPSTKVEFEKQFTKPVVFRGLAKSCKIMELSYEFIFDHFPESKMLRLTADLEENEKFAMFNAASTAYEIDDFYHVDLKRKYRDEWPLSFKHFWDEVKHREIERHYYIMNVDELSYFVVAKRESLEYSLTSYLLDALEKDNKCLGVFQGLGSKTLFLTGPGCVRLAHSHDAVLLTQLTGQKLITLVAPEDASKDRKSVV